MTALQNGPLPTKPGTIVAILNTEGDGDVFVEHFVRLPDEGTVDGCVWLSVYDHSAWDITPVDGWTLVSVPLSEQYREEVDLMYASESTDDIEVAALQMLAVVRERRIDAEKVKL